MGILPTYGGSGTQEEEKPMNEVERVREQIAQIDIRLDKLGLDFATGGFKLGTDYADQILSLEGIAVLDDDQNLPNKWTYAGNVHGDDFNAGYSTAQQDMLKAGFKKVKQKGVDNEICRM